jgi:hypothetical protein
MLVFCANQIRVYINCIIREMDLFFDEQLISLDYLVYCWLLTY